MSLVGWATFGEPRWGVRIRVYDVRENVTIYDPTGSLVGCVVVGDTRVRLDLSDVGGK